MMQILLKQKEAGADIAGSEDLIEEISQGNLNFELLSCNSRYDAKISKTRSSFRT